MERFSNALTLLFTAIPVFVLFLSWFLLSQNRRVKLEELKIIDEAVTAFEIPDATDPLADLKWETFTTSLARYSRLSSRVRISLLSLIGEVFIIGTAAGSFSIGLPYAFGCLLDDGTHIFGRDAFEHCPAKIPYFADSFTAELLLLLVLFIPRLWYQIDEVVSEFLLDEYSRLNFGLRVLASKKQTESSQEFHGPLKPVDALIWEWIGSYYFPLVTLTPKGVGRASVRGTVALLLRTLAVLGVFLTVSIWTSFQLWQEAYGELTALLVGTTCAGYCFYFITCAFFEAFLFTSARQAMDDSIRELFVQLTANSTYIYGGKIEAQQLRVTSFRPRMIISVFGLGWDERRVKSRVVV